MDEIQTWLIAAGGLILIGIAVWAIVVASLHETRQVHKLVRCYYQQCESFRTGISHKA